MPNNGLNEADTRAKLIDPALHKRGWNESMIRREILPGRVELRYGKPTRVRRSADYVLTVDNPEGGQPLVMTIVEAKAESVDPGVGVEQVKRYGNLANRHNVRFVYSTNGHRFLEHDRVSGITSDLKRMSEFPTPAELIDRYERDLGAAFGSDGTKPLSTDYANGRESVRYYQDAAIRAVFEKLAKGENRVLLSMATGTGKTLVAVNILKRIESAGQLRRALFVCDRDALREQARNALHAIFGDDVAMVKTGRPEKNARVVVATYQTLNVGGNDDDEDTDASFIKRHYGEDYFSHIIIDECHRSAWNKWSQVLTLNSHAVQIGLTATPREFEYREGSEEADADREITRDNIRYFGEPVYEYGIGSGMDDGYLALMLVNRYDTHLAGRSETERETGFTKEDLESAHEVVDVTTGESADISEARSIYGATVFEERVVLPDRRLEMCDALFNSLCAQGNPEQKSIVFCVNVSHAIAVANSLNNLYAEWCWEQGRKPKPEFAFPCTGEVGSEHLADFRGLAQSFFVATTADLLTTGVDIPWVENIVFFRYVKSPMLFHQMIGRGTRIDENSGKLAFTVHDFTNATRLLGEDLIQRIGKATDIKPSSPPPEKTFEAHGVEVEVREQGNFVSVMNDDGAMELIDQREYQRRIAALLTAHMPDAESMRKAWSNQRSRIQLVNNFPGGPNYVLALRDLSGMEDFDLYDVLAHWAYGEDALSRMERARRFETANSEWLADQPEPTRSTILAICSQFRKGGIENLEDKALMDTPEVKDAGGRDALSQYREGGASEAIRDLKLRLFRVS